jgi:NAD-dependent deacetylase
VPLEEDIERAAELLTSARYAVAFTGAGVSTPSGIPDFRSPGSGLWTSNDPMAVASIQAFLRDPRVFYQWMSSTAALFVEAHPNPAHIALAELEKLGLLKAVITQNIDNLHQRAGSKRVLEVHGHLREAVCLTCQQVVGIEGSVQECMLEGEVPRCRSCGGVLKPMAVLMGEPLPADVFLEAQVESQSCDVMLVAGSSLTVVPAADLLYLARRGGSRLIIVNYQNTPADYLAEVVVREDVAQALPQIVRACRERIEGYDGL